MEITYTNLSANDVPLLASRLEAEPYPAKCNVLLLEGIDASGAVVSKQLRLEVSANLPGVLLQFNQYEERIDWAIEEFVALARLHGAP